ncbi:MAG: LamG-like jellyroll fold domain-containing protein [Saprospiraceae bacterium]
MKHLFSVLLLVALAAGTAFGQQKPEPPALGPDAPQWAKMLAADAPNVLEIQQAYRDFYEDQPFVKNSYTQYFKRWMQWARPYTQADGSLLVPTADEQAAFEKTVAELRSDGAAKRGAAAGSWTFNGPNKHLREDGSQTPISRHTNIYSFDIAPSNASILYAGGESGGLWKTTDKGLNWTLLTKNITHGAFGAVKIHPTNPDIVWAATSGKIVKTTNGGTSWTTVYTLNGLWVNEFAVSTANPDIIIAATDQGLLRSTNGGTSWTNLFAAKAWTVKQKVGDGTTFYAVRKNGSSSQFVRSTDSGATWTVIGAGWYAAAAGETISGAIIAVCPSNAAKLYVYLAGDGGTLGGYVGVFVSANGGTNWANTHPTNAIGQPYSIPNHVNLLDADGVDWFYQGFYDMGFAVNPTNENELIAGGCSWWKSTNGGQTWQPFGGYVGNQSGYRHPDVQWINWVGSDLWIATDGGLDYSTNRGTTIESRNNGISGADLWGFDSGWNEDILVGGRYHNGNMGYHQNYPAGQYIALGGAESATGYVNPGPGRKTYHSDIGGYSLPTTLAGVPQGFSVSDWPNESYAYYANSEMEWHPNSWGIVFLGKDNKLWKSTDGGSTFAAIYTFPGTADNKVFDIEISRQNPNIMYCSQWDGTDDKIWRSTNGGTTWTACTALPLPNNNDRVKLALSDASPNTLWAAVTYGSNGKKIYKSTNGGQTWNNLTTSLLNGLTVQNIMAQYGTNDGVYLGTNGGVFYRNNTHNDWQPYSDGLPLSVECNRLKPFYKTGKIRNGSWGFGVWESPLFEPSTPKAVAMADKLYAGCARDTFFFDDHSAVPHAGAKWAWQFPGAAMKKNVNTRTPFARYPAPGNYTAIMALTYAGTTTYDTLFLTVGSECAIDSFPGKAVTFGGNAAPGSVVIPALGITPTDFTVTAWIKPDGIQPDYAGIFMFDGTDAAGFNFKSGNNMLGYHWPGGAWWWNSNLIVPSGQWSHVAMVKTPTSVTLYLNGVAAAHTGQTLAPVTFNTTSQLGTYRSWGDRNMKGSIDEVCIYDKALTQSEIRLRMNLIRPANEPNLVAYYQFNEVGGGTVYDRVKTRHASLGGSAARTNSTVAVGPGKAFAKTITAAGTHLFTGTDLTVVCPAGTLPGGEVVATRINLQPDQKPTADPASRAYWVVRNFGTNQNFTQLSKIAFGKIGNVPSTTTPAQYKLYRRAVNGEGNTWAYLDAGDIRTAGLDGKIQFTTGNGVTQFGQFVVSKPVALQAQAIENEEIENPQTLQRSPFGQHSKLETQNWEARVWPSLAQADGKLNIETDLVGQATFRLMDEKGRALRLAKFEGNTAIDLNGLAPGTYFYRIENEAFMQNGKVVVQ